MAASMVLAVGTNLYVPFLYKDFFNLLAQGTQTPAEQLVNIIFRILIIHGFLWLGWRIGSKASMRGNVATSMPVGQRS